MCIAFSLEGTGIILLLLNAYNPVAFVILSGVVCFAWREIYSRSAVGSTRAFVCKTSSRRSSAPKHR